MVKLTTNPPERRPRCLAKAPSRKHVQSRLGEAAAEELRFEDGKIEQYQNRPRSRHPAPVLEPNRQGRTPPLQPQVPFSDTNPDFCSMTYPDFHSKYKTVRAKALTATRLEQNNMCWRSINQPALTPDEKPHLDDRYVVARAETVPIAYDWRLPDRHGPLYFYQKLVLNRPFRDSTPSAMITYASNPTGSLHEECKLSYMPGSDTDTILPDGDLAEVVRRDASARLFQPDQVDDTRDRPTIPETVLDHASIRGQYSPTFFEIPRDSTEIPRDDRQITAPRSVRHARTAPRSRRWCSTTRTSRRSTRL